MYIVYYKHMAKHHFQRIIKYTHWAYKDLWNRIPTPIKLKTQFGKQAQPQSGAKNHALPEIVNI